MTFSSDSHLILYRYSGLLRAAHIAAAVVQSAHATYTGKFYESTHAHHGKFLVKQCDALESSTQFNLSKVVQGEVLEFAEMIDILI